MGENVKRFAAYVRVSTDDQGERDSLRVAQPNAILEYVKGQGGIVTVFAKDVQSGLEDDRLGWQNILEAARRGLIDAVAVWRIDRFGREPADVFVYWRALDRLDVELHSTSEGTDRFVLELMAVVGKQESRTTSKRVRQVQAEMVRLGKWVSRPPLGYDAAPSDKGEGTRLVPNAKAPIVRFLFRHFAETRSNNATRREVRERFGLKLSRVRLQHVLRNPLYIGRVVYGRRENSKVTHRRGKRPEAEWAESTGKHEPLIDQETWATVQSILDANMEARAALGPFASYYLTGKAFCGTCGGRMRGQKLNRYSKRDRSKIGQTHAYLHDDDNTCRPRTRSGPRADNAVKAELMRIPLFPEAEMLMASQLVQSALTGGDAARRQEKKLKAQRAKHEREYKGLLRDKAAEKSKRRKRAYDDLLGEQEAAIDAIDAELAAAHKLDTRALATVAVMLQAPPFDWAQLQETDDPALWRSALDRFVERVELGQETRVIFKPHLAEVIAAVERGESLPESLRDVVIKRGQSALKLIDEAEKQAQAEVERGEQESAWAGEGSAAAVGLLSILKPVLRLASSNRGTEMNGICKFANRNIGSLTNFNVFLDAFCYPPESVVYDETKRVACIVTLGVNSTSNRFDQCVGMTTSLSGIQFGECSIDRSPHHRPSCVDAVFPGTEVVASTALSSVSGAATLCFGFISSCRPKSQGHKGDAYHCQRQQPPGLEYNSTIVHYLILLFLFGLDADPCHDLSRIIVSRLIRRRDANPILECSKR